MAEELEETISHLCGWVNGCIFIVVTRLYSHMIRRALLTSTLNHQDPAWDLGSGLVLAQ